MRPEYDPDLPPGWLPVRDAADNLGVSRQRVHALIRFGLVDAVRRGRWWIVSRESLDVYAIEHGRPIRADRLALLRARLRRCG